MDTAVKAKLAAVAPKITAATPSTSSSVLALFKSLFLPLLPGIVGTLIASRATEKTKKILRQVRDVLVDADLGD